MNRMRQLFQRGETDADASTDDGLTAVDVEAARIGGPLGAHPVNLAAAAQSSNPAEQLSAFRQLVGITKEPGIASPSAGGKGAAKGTSGSKGSGARPAQNVGIYGRVVKNETASRRSFTIYSLIINGALGLQVVIAAALTAMGAGSANHTVITVFGAFNTIIAGFLTYLKGSGLPGRLKYYENSWRKVREAIEQRERDFTTAATFGTPLPSGQTLDKAVADIEKLYKDTVTDIEVNTPDNYTALTKQGGGKTPTVPTPGAAGSGSSSGAAPHAGGGGGGGGSSVLPPGTAPDLRRGDYAGSNFHGEHVKLAYPEKAHPRSPSSADEPANADSEKAQSSAGSN